MSLLYYVGVLEGRDSRVRGDCVLEELGRLGIVPTIEECRWPRIRNLVVDFCPDARTERLLFSAHYDVVRGAPGANDDASGVAVLLGLCAELKGAQAPARVVFFDHEEAWFRTRYLRLGLLGSLYHVFRRRMSGIAAVYNLEFVGQGDHLAAWPVKAEKSAPESLARLKSAAAALSVPVEQVSIPWVLMSSDHLSFRLRGVREAVTLSLVPADRVQQIADFLTAVSVRSLLAGRRAELPEPLSRLHTAGDTSDRLSERSLRLMLSLVRELVREFEVSSSPHPLPKGEGRE